MPNKFDNSCVYLGPYSSPETFNPTTLYQPGDLGKKFLWQGRQYQIVQNDAVGTTTANGLVFWSSKTAYTVTNAVGSTTNIGGRNAVAGVAPLAAAASSYLAIRTNYPSATVKFSGTTAAAGDVLVSHTNSTLGETVIVAQGTAPTCMTVGVVVTGSTGTSIVADVNMQVVVD